MNIRFLLLAQQEVDEAVAWFDENADGKGNDFLDELDRVMTGRNACPTKSMQANPAMMRRRRERLFYLGMSAVVIVTVFAGFAPTYYLRPLYTTTPLVPLLHLHGLVFSSWLVLFVTQTTLVAARRTDIHRRLGLVGGVIAVMMVLVGVSTAVIRAGQAAAAPDGGPAPLVFLVVPLGDMLVFAILVGAGFYFRRRPDVHKRLMLLATLSILPAATARLPFAFVQAPIGFFGLTDLFIVACVLYDLITLRRVHRATALAGLLIVASQPLRLMIGNTHAWLSFATWLTQLAA